MSKITQEQANQALAKINKNMGSRPCPFCGSMSDTFLIQTHLTFLQQKVYKLSLHMDILTPYQSLLVFVSIVAMLCNFH